MGLAQPLMLRGAGTPLADATSGSVDAKLGSLGHGPPLGRQPVASIAEGAAVLNLRKATAWPNFLGQSFICKDELK